MWSWIRHRISHKIGHLNKERLVNTLKNNGLALVVIIITWEILEDVVFPVVFVWLGTNIHPIFLAGAPASILLCFHWLAVPAIWGLWIKIKNLLAKVKS